MTDTNSQKSLKHYVLDTEDGSNRRRIYTSIESDSDIRDDENDCDFNIGEDLESIQQRYRSYIPNDIDIGIGFDEAIKESTQEKREEESVISCTHCCNPRRVENVSCFKKGQHIQLPGEHLKTNVFRKLIAVYYHHAIVKKVISASGTTVELELIHFAKKEGKINITAEEKKINLENDEIHIIDYERQRYGPETIVKRAESMMPEVTPSKGQKQFSSYNFVLCNCEHFASWCVVGEGESFQVKGGLKSLKKVFVKTAAVGCKIWRFAKCLHRIARLGHTPGIVLGASALLYLLYTVCMTIYYRKKYSKGKLCNICMKRNIISLWSNFVAFCVTSGFSYLIVYFLLLIVHPPVGIPLLIALVILPLILQWGVSKLFKALMPLYACEGIEIKDLSEITPGSMISFSYFGFRHYAIVTEKGVESDETQVGSIKYVHYGLKGNIVLGTREVMEEGFKLSLKKNVKNVKLIDCRKLRFPPKTVVERVRARIGETKWGPLSNRSDHLCFYSMVQEETGKDVHGMHQPDESESTSKRVKSTLYFGKREIHLKRDLQIGQIVEYDGQTGLIVALEDITGKGEQGFKMELIVYSMFKAIHKKYIVDLKMKRLFVKKYHAAHCCPSEERVKRALQNEGKKCKFWTQNGFLRSCILKNI